MTITSDQLRENVQNAIVAVSQFRWQTLFHQLMEVLNSNEEVDPSDPSFEIVVERIPMQQGGGRNNKSDYVRRTDLNMTFQEFVDANTSLDCPPETLSPNLCGAAALLIGLDRIQGDKQTLTCKFSSMRKRLAFNRRMWQLCRNGGVSNPTAQLKALTLKQMQEIIKNPFIFKDVGICILDYHKGNAVVYKHNVDKLNQISILLYREHFFYIRNMPGFFGQDKGVWCPVCEKVYAGKFRHHCLRQICQFCKCAENCNGETVKCAVCLRVFKGGECFERHKVTGVSPLYKTSSVCRSIMACYYCNKDLKAKEGVRLERGGNFRDAYRKQSDRHVCYSVKCYTCDARYDSRESNHRCFVQKFLKLN